MRYVLAAVCLLGVVQSGGAAAQTAKECAILKRAVHGDATVDGSKLLLSGQVPPDLQWPVPSGARTTYAIGKGTYTFSVELDPAQAQEFYDALTKQVAQCLPGSARFANKIGQAVTFCPTNVAKVVSVVSAGTPKSPQVALTVNAALNPAQLCR